MCHNTLLDFYFRAGNPNRSGQHGKRKSGFYAGHTCYLIGRFCHSARWRFPSPVLKEIGDMLKQHSDLKIEIVGHTDNVGGAASNQTLSEKRAAAVKEYLVKNYQIDASRLASKGFGASKPVASNDTPDGRQANRRVELVKM